MKNPQLAELRPSDSPAPRSSPGDNDFASTVLEATSVEDLLQRHTELLVRLKLCYGADRLTFDRDLMPLIRRYAENVSTLPGTRDEAFHEAGGLLRMGLEIAFFALQAADSHIFSGRETISARRDLEPRWRLAAFVAGLCAEVHRPLSQFVVTDTDGHIWPVHLTPLAVWLTERRCRQFRLRWLPRAEDSRVMGLCLLQRIVPEATLHELSTNNLIIPRHLLSCVAGIPLHQEPNVLDHIVRRATALVLDRELRAQACRQGTTKVGSHVSRYLMEGIRHLVSSDPAWRPNGPRSRVWLGPDGAFIVWPGASSDLSAWFGQDGLVGMPSLPAEMVSALRDAGVIETHADGADTWLIRPPGAKSAVAALKLVVADWLGSIVEGDIVPLPNPLLEEPPASGRGTAAQAAAPWDDSHADEKVDTTPPMHAQLPLFDAACPPGPAPIYLRAPPRLNPAVRAVLAEIVDTLNGTAQRVAAHWQPEGLLIPLAEVDARHLDPALAVRTLAETGMLILPADRNAKTFSRTVADEPVLGVILDPKWIVQPPPLDSAPVKVNLAHAAPEI